MSPDLVAQLEPFNIPRIDERVYLRVRPGQQHSFSPRTGLRLV